MRRSNEPLWWAPFSAGMMVDALAAPALILITGFLVPFGIVTGGLRGFLTHPLWRFCLFGFVVLTFFHAAHRLRFVLGDMGLGSRQALAVLLYGGAVIGSLAAAWVTFT